MSINRRLSDLLAALRHLPDRAGWRAACIELAWALPLLLIVAHAGGLARLQSPPAASTAATLAATLFVMPALLEELLFRGLIIPREGPKAQWITLSVLLFVLWHPLQVVTFGPPWAGSFLDPWFLIVVGILGLALARMYAATRSLWPSILTHWLVVLGWKAVFGGPF
ncbi:MAG TPA: CPBP family glutamic-type intramembrane protease [Allosphingosinicella sp.]|nr:CPBP family glutamic-type intramembrane protease [Allosphingosinicella sp.]